MTFQSIININKILSILKSPLASRSSFIVKITKTKDDYLTMVSNIAEIYGNPIKEGWYIANVQESMDCYILILRGKPDKRYSLLSLLYNCEITIENK